MFQIAFVRLIAIFALWYLAIDLDIVVFKRERYSLLRAATVSKGGPNG